MTWSANAQVPAILWTTNVGGTAFAIDAQTNVYAFNTGNITVINDGGAVISSNLVCPAPGASTAGRDATGNIYFAGSFSGTQDFGGMKLTNNGSQAPFFCAKYSSAGSLVWVTQFGAAIESAGDYYSNCVGNLAVTPEGVVYVAYNNGYSDSGSYLDASAVDQFGTNGTNKTVAYVYDNHTYTGMARVGAVTANTGALLHLYQSPYPPGSGPNPYIILCTWTSNSMNQANPAGSWPYPFAQPPPIYGGVPLADPQGNLMYVRNGFLYKQNASGSILLDTPIGNWLTMAPELGGGVYVADQSNQVARYDYAGNQVWLLPVQSNCTSFVVDSQGNRFFSLATGLVGRLANDYFAPSITNGPQSQIVFSGSNAVFSAGATGSTPLYFQWLFQGEPLPGDTNAVLTLQDVTEANVGSYSVIVSNYEGSITSAPVNLTVKEVEVFDGGTMLTNGTYNFSSPPTLSILSAFTNGEIYYTLDGSTPSFSSIPYSGPFTLTSNATINAIGYSADFSQSAYADTVIALVPPQYTLNASTAGGGTISLNPSGGVYGSNTIVTATAIPASGYSFLYWQGAASGTNTSAKVLMNQNQTLTAVFGTTLSTTVEGNGQVLLSPPGGLYAYGTTVRIEGLAQPGNYFGVWGNAASGSTNPLYFTITNPMPTVSSLFAALGTNQSALTLLVLGQGKVSANPAGNVFATNQSVSITATPNAGQSFLYWSGNASGSQNPLSVSMAQSEVIMAHFSGQSVALGRAGGFSSNGFQFDVSGDPQAVYEIFDSTDLVNWQSIGWVTNNTGVTSFTDPSATNAPMKFYRALLTQ